MSDHELSPSAEYRFFIYNPQGNGFQYYASVEARDAARDGVIQSYLDDGWDDEVEHIVAGEVTHACQQVGREERPEANELDAERCDRDGKYWGDWQYTCNYDLLPLEPLASPVMALPIHGAPVGHAAPLVVPDLILPRAAVEGDELVIRITLDTLCHAVTMADNWPTHGDGLSAATIVDRPLFVKELIGELQRENEQGATPLHFLFDEAALAVIEWGSEAVELHEEPEDEDA